MTIGIKEIRLRVVELGKLISAPQSYLVVPDQPTSDGTPYVEVINDEYHYVSADRGMEISRRVTSDVDQLLYWILKRASSAMASNFEFKNRIENKDTRRIKFSKQIEIIGKLSPSWAHLMSMEIEEILKSAPYDDLSSERVKYCKKLMVAGISNDDAYKKACEKYPLPIV